MRESNPKKDAFAVWKPPWLAFAPRGAKVAPTGSRVSSPPISFLLPSQPPSTCIPTTPA